uniref:G-protein coupled receptors family 1 profile domain-containing protein n=1 Tax=Salarias fasciatus TaxID=181472 RepID=A0A672GXN9_SALFA
MSLHNSSIELTHFFFGDVYSFTRPVVSGVVIMIVYIILTIANAVNIVFIVSDQKLHKPMYLLICNLAVVDIMITSSVIPTIIGVLFGTVKSISYVPCLIQMFVYHWSSVMEMFALAFMAFDRVLAVSYPFQYHNYLTNARTLITASILWLSSACIIAVTPATVIPLPHCYPKLKYIYCDYAALVRSTCANVNYYFNLITVIVFFLLFFTFVFICLSYIVIFFQVKLSSSSEKRKIGSTCLSHLIVVSCYYGPIFVRVVLTRVGLVLTLEEWYGVVFVVIIGPPFVNPFVYCLRTKEIRFKLMKVF